MHDRISRLGANVLAHRAGLLVFNVFTLCWFVAAFAIPELDGGKVAAFVFVMLAGYLDVVTWFGGATQFTLAYEARQAKEAALLAEQKTEQALLMLEQTIRNQVDVMKFLLDGQEAIKHDLDEIDEDLRRFHQPVPGDDS